MSTVRPALLSPLPLWERVAPHGVRRRVRGFSPRIETPHPARSGAQVRSKARHLLPPGEKGNTGANRSALLLPCAVDDDGAELVAFFHREVGLRRLRQRKLRGDIVDA